MVVFGIEKLAPLSRPQKTLFSLKMAIFTGLFDLLCRALIVINKTINTDKNYSTNVCRGAL